MRREVRRRGRCAVPFEIDRRGDHGPPEKADAPRHQRGIGDLARAERQVQPLLDHVAVLVAHHQFDRQSGMSRQQRRQPCGEEQPARDRGSQPDQPARRAALPPEHCLHLIGTLQQVPGVRQQDLAVVGEAEPAGGAMEQTDLEMLLQLCDQTGDSRLAHMGFPGDG